VARDGRWFLAWTLLGAGFAFSVLAALTFGIFVVPVVLAFTVLAVRRSSTRSRAGVVAGLGLPVLWVAWLNRDGPGTICHSTATGQTCGDQYNPLPWVVIGLLLVAAGFIRFQRTGQRH